MTEVVGIRFKEVGKIYCFDPKGETLTPGQYVIVETARGVECGQVATGNEMVEEDKIVAPLKPIVRLATEDDIKKVAENRQKEKSAFTICEEKIAKHGLEMKLTDVEYTFDGSKILFYFTADGRVDFRELVKDLAAVFKTRIELRQIGVRDEAKMLGGIGICGRPFCCNAYMGEFQPVSIKMAKEQGLSLNPTKISGACGRLMCCLKYEQEAYEHLAKITPKAGALVETKDGRGIVTESNLISGVVKVRLDRNPDAAPSTYNTKQVKILRDVKTTVSKEEREALKAIEE
ncbi:MAG: stage 0 sporulation family protein [Oscillospiraceae bacterium]|nr:stage 0 sporulation family protein [Candidatus Limimonas egerieequi]